MTWLMPTELIPIAAILGLVMVWPRLQATTTSWWLFGEVFASAEGEPHYRLTLRSSSAITPWFAEATVVDISETWLRWFCNICISNISTIES